MNLFDRIVLGFVGSGTAALFGIAASLPFNWSTHSPEAVLISPENIAQSVMQGDIESLLDFDFTGN